MPDLSMSIDFVLLQWNLWFCHRSSLLMLEIAFKRDLSGFEAILVFDGSRDWNLT